MFLEKSQRTGNFDNQLVHKNHRIIVDKSKVVVKNKETAVVSPHVNKHENIVEEKKRVVQFKVPVLRGSDGNQFF
jgi:hypothetical protein